MSPRLIMTLDVTETMHDPGDILRVTLTHPRRPALPAFTAGAHVDVRLPDGRVRHYSLYGDPEDRSCYRIAVKLERDGRGGSRWLHETLRPGATLLVSAPRNHFELATDATHHILLGGGIGITPILAMAQALTASGASFEVHDFARSRATAPLLAELVAVVDPARLHLHLDDELASRADLAALLSLPREGHRVSCCGPAGFMDAVRAATAAWPQDAVRFEAFKPLSDEGFVPEPFDMILTTSGRRLHVPAERTALDVLREAGIALPSSCEIGVCGSCVCDFEDGEPIHRDVLLSPGDRRHRFVPCVSRAKGSITVSL